MFKHKGEGTNQSMHLDSLNYLVWLEYKVSAGSETIKVSRRSNTKVSH